MDELKKTILYLSYDGMTDPLGQSQVLPYLIGVSTQGYKYILISFEKQNRFIENKAIIEKICFENNIQWLPLMYTKKPPILSTLKDIYALNKLVKKILKEKEISIIHCRSYITSLIGLEFKQKRDIPFVFDMRGFWADERIDGGIWNTNNFLFKSIYNFFKKKEKQFLQQSNAIVSLTHNAKNEITTNICKEVNPQKIYVIPCCVDNNFFSKKNIDGVLYKNIKTELNSLHVLGYFGSLGTWYMSQEMLEFFVEYKKKYSDAKLLVVTLDNTNEFFEIARMLGLNQNDIIVKQSTRLQMPTYIASVNYGLFFIKPSYSKKASSPTKQAEIMSLGVPIICNKGVGDCDFVVEKYSCGISCELNQPVYISTLDKLETLNFNSEDIISASQDFFSLQKGVATYANIYNSILSNVS